MYCKACGSNKDIWLVHRSDIVGVYNGHDVEGLCTDPYHFLTEEVTLAWQTGQLTISKQLSVLTKWKLTVDFNLGRSDDGAGDWAAIPGKKDTYETTSRANRRGGRRSRNKMKWTAPWSKPSGRRDASVFPATSKEPLMTFGESFLPPSVKANRLRGVSSYTGVNRYLPLSPSCLLKDTVYDTQQRFLWRCEQENGGTRHKVVSPPVVSHCYWISASVSDIRFSLTNIGISSQNVSRALTVWSTGYYH